MSYAIKKDGTGWRAVASAADIHVLTETFSLTIPSKSIAQLRNEAVAKTYGDIDAIYAAAVGGRTEEYKLAEADALAFKAAGYSGVCPVSVSSWKPSSALTNQQKADTIIAQAIALRSAITDMRVRRFAAQDAYSNAADKAALDAAVAVWDAFIVSTRAALGLK